MSANQHSFSHVHIHMLGYKSGWCLSTNQRWSRSHYYWDFFWIKHIHIHHLVLFVGLNNQPSYSLSDSGGSGGGGLCHQNHYHWHFFLQQSIINNCLCVLSCMSVVKQKNSMCWKCIVVCASPPILSVSLVT